MPTIRDTLETFPRVPLTRTPTPLHYLEHLSADLCVNVYLKRDDLTDMTFGGDKPRKLEYEIARAQAAGADTLVTCGSSQSNHARLTTAASRRVGMDCVVVLSEDDWNRFQGNLLTVYLMGATVRFVDSDDHWDLEKYAREVITGLESEGRVPHYIPVSGTTPYSCLGYVRGALETLDQLHERGIKPDAVYTPFGTGGIFAAMLLTFRNLGIVSPFVGISVNRRLEKCRENLETWWSALCKLLHLDPQPERGAYAIHDEYIGREYGEPTEACLDAILKVGQTEGILLDPVYSGKVMAGFMAHHREGRWRPGQDILILHSGGTPALFAYHQPLKEHLIRRDLLPPDRFP